MKNRIIRIGDVCHLTSLGRSTIYNLMKSGDFPSSIKLTEKSIGWRIEAIENWINSREVANDPDSFRKSA